MALPLGTALAYGVLPALVGAAIGVQLLRPARWAAAEVPTAKGPALVVHAMLATGPMLAFVAAILAATQEPSAPASFLVMVGVTAGLVSALQGWLGGQGFEAVARDTSQFGRLLIKLVLPETLVVLALVGFLLRTVTG